MQYSGIAGFGAGKVSWKADGSALAYAMRSLSSISQISATPSYGSIGEKLPVVEGASPGPVAWGPTAATKNQYLYSSADNPFYENLEGIYLNTVGDASGGTKLVYISTFYDAEPVHDIEWLPDGSGFLFTKFYVHLSYFRHLRVQLRDARGHPADRRLPRRRGLRVQHLTRRPAGRLRAGGGVYDERATKKKKNEHYQLLEGMSDSGGMKIAAQQSSKTINQFCVNQTSLPLPYAATRMLFKPTPSTSPAGFFFLFKFISFHRVFFSTKQVKNGV